MELTGIMGIQGVGKLKFSRTPPWYPVDSDDIITLVVGAFVAQSSFMLARKGEDCI